MVRQYRNGETAALTADNPAAGMALETLARMNHLELRAFLLRLCKRAGTPTRVAARAFRCGPSQARRDRQAKTPDFRQILAPHRAE